MTNTDNRFVSFCIERVKILGDYRLKFTYVDSLTEASKQRVLWLEFVGLMETAHLVWYYEYHKNLDD